MDKVDIVNIFNWENLELGHLRLSPTVSSSRSYTPHDSFLQGSVPVLVTEEGKPLTGEDIYQHLDKLSSPGTNVFTQ